MDKVSVSHLFSFSRYQTKCVTEFLFRQLMTSWTLRFIFNHPPKQWPTGRKREKDRNIKNWISREWKELFRWNKMIFHSFWRAIILWKNKNVMKIVDTSFKRSWIEENILLLLFISKEHVILYCKASKVFNFKLFSSFQILQYTFLSQNFFQYMVNTLNKENDLWRNLLFSYIKRDNFYKSTALIFKN